MASDPRRRRVVKTEAEEAPDPMESSNVDINQNENQNQSASILFEEGDDAMDEDEDLFDSSEPLQDEPSSGAANAATDNNGDGGASTSYYSSGVVDNYNNGSSVVPHRDVELLSTVISPSPFAHHTSGGAGSSRYRNALTRIGADPRSDVEAWGALLAEASACWKSLYTPTASNSNDIGGSNSTNNMQVVHVNIAARTSAETQLQLDWIESCYGAFLKYFPYSCGHIRSFGDILFVQSARVGEEGGPATDYGQEAPGTMSRSQQAQWKLETILRKSLGVDLEGNNASATVTVTATGEETETNNGGDNDNDDDTTIAAASLVGGICTPSVELWLLYIKTRIRHVKRKNSKSNAMEGAKAILEESKKAYELALGYAGFTCHENHFLWKDYLSFCKASVPPVVSEREQNAALLIMTPQQHMMWLREVYQKLVCHPMTGLDQLWQEYESFEKNQSEALAAALIQEWQPKYQHARNVYLERNKVFSPQDLNWKTRLAVPPVSTAWLDRMDAERGSTGTGVVKGSDSTKKLVDDKGDASGGTTTEEDLREHHDKLREEFDYLTLWKKRCAYERTNPERLSHPQELAHRIRQAYKEMVGVLTLYPEVWHMWSTWEDTVATATTSAAANDESTTNSAENPAMATGNRSIAVLQLGQEHIPDSTLLVQAHVQLEEVKALSNTSASATGKTKAASSSKRNNSALKVLENYLERAPTSLGFCLYQRLVRRYKGKDESRAVFAKARRVLSHGSDRGKLGASSTTGEKTDGIGTEPSSTEESSKLSSLGTQAIGTRWMVTNRLDPSIGSARAPSITKSQNISNSTMQDSNNNTASSIQISPGPITWHLYACHATIEHRLNKSPEIAARVFELGLRKHSSFLTKPPYVLKYAKLLLELQDTVNLRALLTRALAACGNSNSSGHIEALWDMTLECEELWSISEPANIEAAIAIERKRRTALMGPEIEDVSTGSRVGLSDNRATVGSQKSTLAEQLIRTDGYNTSSLIVNGLSRTVNVLDIMGLWGDGAGGKQYSNRSNSASDDGVDDELIPGGKSDRSYQNRLQFAERLASGVGMMLPGGLGGSEVPGSKLLSARERLQQQGGGGPGFQNTAMQLAIQQNPEWLRGILLLLPASRLRNPIVPKAPPHLVVQALTVLRQNKLPDERPKDDNGGRNSSSTLSGNKRSMSGMNNGGDSSDEDTGPRGSGGYGKQFRARQQARMNGVKTQNY